MAQNRFGLTPSNHVTLSFSLAMMKQHKEDISPLMVAALSKPDAPKGLVFAAKDNTKKYEIAILGITARSTLFQSLSSQIEFITCSGNIATGAYFMATQPIGFNSAGKDQDFQFRDQNGRPCYLKASPAFMQNIKFSSRGAMLIIAPGYSRTPN